MHQKIFLEGILFQKHFLENKQICMFLRAATNIIYNNNKKKKYFQLSM